MSASSPARMLVTVCAVECARSHPQFSFGIELTVWIVLAVISVV